MPFPGASDRESRGYRALPDHADRRWLGGSALRHERTALSGDEVGSPATKSHQVLDVHQFGDLDGNDFH